MFSKRSHTNAPSFSLEKMPIQLYCRLWSEDTETPNIFEELSKQATMSICEPRLFYE